MRRLQDRAVDLVDVDREDFPLPHVGPALEGLRAEVLDGRGFVMIRGLPIGRYSSAEAAAIFIGLGHWIGRPRSQNGKGHILGHVCDLGLDIDNPKVRIYQTTSRQTFHTDSCDVVGLLCLKTAKSGGLSSLVSATTVYNEMLAQRPDLADLLFDPVATDRRGEVPDGQLPWFNIPVLNWCDGRLIPLYQRKYVNSAQALAGAPRLSEQQIDALDLFDRLTDDPDLHLDLALEPGDIQLVCNHTILHDRTGYEDWPDPARRRHLLRLWLSPPMGRRLPPVFAERYGSIEIGDRGGIVLKDAKPTVPLAPE